MTPTEAVLATSGRTMEVTDAGGRRITLRNLSALDKLRLFKAAGPMLAQNQPWLGMAVLACSVTAIDDVPVPTPTTEQQIEAIVARLGDAGIDAVAAVFDAEPAADRTETTVNAGN